MELLDIFQQSQTFWIQEPHYAVEGISCLTLRKSNPGFHSTTKGLEEEDDMDQQGCPKTVMNRRKIIMSLSGT